MDETGEDGWSMEGGGETECADVGAETADAFYGLDFGSLDEAPETEPAAIDASEASQGTLEETEDLHALIDGVNPNFDPFDVESPWSNNCGSCALAVEGRLNGDLEATAGAMNVGTVADMEAITGKEQVSLDPASIEQTLLEQGPGAHAIVGIDRFDGPGHWFNAVVSADGTRVFAVDGQTGEVQEWPPDYDNVSRWDVSLGKEN